MSIKDIGIDLFINYHPKVSQLKREAKGLHKELKSKGLSLMQCQELIAKRNGFSNWYNFMHMIKSHYQRDFDKIPFLITTNKEKPTKSIYTDNALHNSTDHLSDEPILMGYDINFGHYKWQNTKSMKTHQAILGKDIYNIYDVYLANKSMEYKRPVIFLNGDGDLLTLNSLVKNAIKNDRANGIKIFNFTNYSLYPEYECKIKNSFIMSSGALAELFYNILAKKDDILNAKMISLLSISMMYLVYKRDKENTLLNLEKIRDFPTIENLINAVKEKDIPWHIINAIKVYLNDLPRFNINQVEQNPNVYEQHSILQNEIIKICEKLLALDIFSQNGFDMSQLLDKNNTNTYLFQLESNKNLASLFMLGYIKSNIISYLGRHMERDEHKDFNTGILYLFIRNCFTPRGMAVVPAQARSVGVSVSFSYPSISKMEEINGIEETASALANTNTKIFGSNDTDPKTIAYLNKYKDEIDSNSILNIKQNEISININSTNLKKDYLWIVKHGYASQISFDIPYDKNSIASSNVKMKIEDPKETYALFEKTEQK